MVLNKDCFRDILKYIECHCKYENTNHGRKMHEVSFFEICNTEELSHYDDETKHYVFQNYLKINISMGALFPKISQKHFLLHLLQVLR
jgi:hypothetical protein